MEIGVKNDEQLIKMDTIIQRAVATQSSEGEYTISDDEKEQLLQAMQDLQIDNPEK